MGYTCPKCQTHQAVIEVRTATGEAPVKASEIIFQKLACGHTYGTEEFMAYKEKIAELAKHIKGKQLELEKEFAVQAGKLYEQVIATKQGGRS